MRTAGPETKKTNFSLIHHVQYSDTKRSICNLLRLIVLSMSLGRMWGLMEHIFIINTWKQSGRPMLSRFQWGARRIAVFDAVVGVERRLVGWVDYLRKTWGDSEHKHLSWMLVEWARGSVICYSTALSIHIFTISLDQNPPCTVDPGVPSRQWWQEEYRRDRLQPFGPFKVTMYSI